MRSKTKRILILFGLAASLWACSTRVEDRASSSRMQENRPFAVEILPPMSAAAVAPTEKIRVTFSEPILPATVDFSSFQVTNLSTLIPATGSLSFNPFSTEVTFTPDTLLIIGDTYQIMLTIAIEDSDGSGLFISSATPVPSQFTVDTAVDTVEPIFSGAASATAVSEQSIELMWIPAADLVSPQSEIVYFIYSSTTSGMQDFQSPDAVTSPGGTAFLVTGLLPSTNYFFVVRSRDLHGNFDSNATEVSASTGSSADGIPPSFGGIGSAAATGPTSILLVWTAATDNADIAPHIRYRIYARTAGGSRTLSNPSAETEGGVSSFDFGGLAPEAYLFIVRAVDSSGNEDGNLVEIPGVPVMSYGRSIQPIFDMQCTQPGCHELSVAPAGGLMLNTYGGIAAGGGSGPAFVAGNPPDSRIVRRIDDQIQAPDPPFLPTRMPSGGFRLDSRDILNIREWILQGGLDN
ncbi:MAG: Ig-like domain-containing protein [Planctomycetota bacterium]|nr:Ig-like domain-containing protein [Planctomycetota bacterium]